MEYNQNRSNNYIDILFKHVGAKIIKIKPHQYSEKKFKSDFFKQDPAPEI
ncbi:hypothetical protein AQPE_3545 [Aquipluma nitroreducens]|uniref:Uncharacterized protein n=1 Tax=Aquipluma nitroreducens TaxID=2010828 RepID=A0A5K7SCR9_9BACT|nr:hypothetical protein AQPE_3545 [Aquipluma nitroreducens]